MSRGALRGVAVAAACAAAFACTAAAAGAAQRYASPTGSGSACSSGTPCPIQTAFGSASPGDEIIVSPGDYSVSANLPVFTSVYAHGVAGQPAPRIHFAPGHYLSDSSVGSRASYLSIDGSGPALLQVGQPSSEADQIYVHSTGSDACFVYGTLIDSVCWTSSPDDIAISGSASNTFTPVLRNVTAEATATGGTGIEYGASSSGSITVTAVNAIAHGTSTDVFAQATSPATVTINTDHSNFVSGSGIGSGAHVNATNKQSTAPAFVNSAAGDFREAAGSPTIDTGITSPANGPFDFLGKPRTINGLTDIGADEYDPFKGVDVGDQKSKVKKRKANVAVGCPAGTPISCTGNVTLTWKSGGKSLTAGSATFSIATGATQFLKVKVTKKTAKKVAKKGKLLTQATATAADGAGTSATTSGQIKLKR